MEVVQIMAMVVQLLQMAPTAIPELRRFVETLMNICQQSPGEAPQVIGHLTNTIHEAHKAMQPGEPSA